MLSAKALANLGLHTPGQVALWARKYGLLSVYLESSPVRSVFPSCWQVIRPGHRTDPKALAWMGGAKTFIFATPKEKATAERRAMDWASTTFDVEEWVKIEGIANAFFPAIVGDSLQAVDPAIVIARNRHVTIGRPV